MEECIIQHGTRFEIKKGLNNFLDEFSKVRDSLGKWPQLKRELI